VNLGERCDEIVRLIDETLADLALADLAVADPDAPLSTVIPLAPPVDPTWARRRGAPPAGPPPEIAAAGF